LSRMTCLIIFSGSSALSIRSLRLARTSVETLSSNAMVGSFVRSRFSVLSQFSVLSSRFSVLAIGPQVRTGEAPVLPSQSLQLTCLLWRRRSASVISWRQDIRLWCFVSYLPDLAQEFVQIHA